MNTLPEFTKPAQHEIRVSGRLSKRADMVLLNANPLKNISNTREIAGVMARGKWLPRETLQRMLDELAGKYAVPKNIQLSIASVLALGAIIYIASIVRGIRNGLRRFGWEFSWGKILRVVLLVAVLALWWVFWHTDTVFSHILHARPENAVTVRMLIPWPAAFVWISLAVTLWFLAWITVTFVPKVKKSL